MRVRTGNVFNEAHGKNLRTYDFIADGSKTPDEICGAIETSLGLRLRGDPAGQHGYVNTSLRPDGSRYVAVTLYEDCDGLDCGAAPNRRHPPHRRANDLTAAKTAAAKTVVGEHLKHRLTGTATDEAILRGLGYQKGDGPMLPGLT